VLVGARFCGLLCSDLECRSVCCVAIQSTLKTLKEFIGSSWVILEEGAECSSTKLHQAYQMYLLAENVSGEHIAASQFRQAVMYYCGEDNNITGDSVVVCEPKLYGIDVDDVPSVRKKQKGVEPPVRGLGKTGVFGKGKGKGKVRHSYGMKEPRRQPIIEEVEEKEEEEAPSQAESVHEGVEADGGDDGDDGSGSDGDDDDK
jgi:hypothetical protein